MHRDFKQTDWDETLVDDLQQLFRLAVREDLDRFCDWTTVSLVPEDAKGTADIVSRKAGVISGLQALDVGVEELQAQIEVTLERKDGDPVEPGTVVATLHGATRDILTLERIFLNVIGRCSGIASLTRLFVDQVSHTQAKIYDTRKTTPGWRRMEKWAVRTGGGTNHRVGLFAAVMIKDNHLAHAMQAGLTPAAAVEQVRGFLQNAEQETDFVRDLILEVEVDRIGQLREVAVAKPDIVLLDNMSCEELSACVAFRQAEAPWLQLEASGGVRLETVREIAETGVDRISVGALTHSAVNFDVGLDWRG